MLLICNLRSFSRPIISKHFQMRNVHYIQGQEPEPKIREYFYFIDHQGMHKVDTYFLVNRKVFIC